MRVDYQGNYLYHAEPLAAALDRGDIPDEAFDELERRRQALTSDVLTVRQTQIAPHDP